MQAEPHILVVDDDREIRTLLSKFLSKEGFRVTVAADGREMRKMLAEWAIDLVVLDLMLPGEDGLALCRSLRASSDIPVIMLTAKGDDVDRIVGLEMGADDYVPKPFHPRELVARIKAVLRRARVSPGGFSGGRMPDSDAKRFRFEGWQLDTARRELISADGVLVPLSSGEYGLLLAFVSQPQRVLSRDQLLDLARGRDAQTFDRAIDVQVSRLRRKIEADPRNPQLIKTVRGGGYLLAATVEHG
jgi:two-component system OmpR family response regulator